MSRHLRIPAKTLWLSSQKREESEETLNEGGDGFKEGFISTDLWGSLHCALCCVWTSRTAFIYIGEWFTTWQWHWTFPENAWNISLSFFPPGAGRENVSWRKLSDTKKKRASERGRAQFELRRIWKHWPWILILWTHRISSWAFNSKWALLNINAVGLGFRHIILNYNPAVCSLLRLHRCLSPFLFLLLSFPISIRLGWSAAHLEYTPTLSLRLALNSADAARWLFFHENTCISRVNHNQQINTHLYLT